MMSNEFEKALDAFLEGADADEAHQALYDIIRAAFLAGWRSAGGDPPQEQKLFELIPGGKPLESPKCCLLYTSPSPRDTERSRMPSSA